MFDLSGILAYSFMGNPVRDYTFVLLASVIVFIILKFFKLVIIKKLESLSKKTKTKFDDALIGIISKIGWPFYILVSLYIGLKFLKFPENVDKWLNYTIIIILTFYFIKAIQGLIDYGTKRIIIKEGEKDKTIIDFLSKLTKAVLWVIGILLILSNLGYNITSLMAGLGIGGVAVALALQNILGDLFASVSIYFDKPFKVGDFIIVGEHMGIIKKIGIKTTRLESLWGEEIIISNTELTSTRIKNYKKMERRRIHFTFGVTYQTKNEKLKKITEIVKKIFDKTELADLDRIHFKEFGNSSLNFEVAYYVNTGDYNKYMDVQQEVNLAIKESFEKEGIEFAYPTSTIFLSKQGDNSKENKL